MDIWYIIEYFWEKVINTWRVKKYKIINDYIFIVESWSDCEHAGVWIQGEYVITPIR